jgi:ATP-dependent DNA helicase RecG
MDAQQQLQRLLTGSGESEGVEFKEAKSNYDFDKLGRYFSALSNEANLKGLSAAWLVFGVNDRQQVVGNTLSRDAQAVAVAEKGSGR